MDYQKRELVNKDESASRTEEYTIGSEIKIYSGIIGQIANIRVVDVLPVETLNVELQEFSKIKHIGINRKVIVM